MGSYQGQANDTVKQSINKSDRRTAVYTPKTTRLIERDRDGKSGERASESKSEWAP